MVPATILVVADVSMLSTGETVMTNHIVVSSRGQRARRFALVFAVILLGFVLGVDLFVLWLGDGTFASVGNFKLVAFLAAFICACGLFQLHRLSGDGARVAKLLGGTLVVLEPADSSLRQFRNVATETAIAAGIPMPKLFVIQGDVCINAFAAGTAGHGTAVAVSAGALKKLSRAELQGVVAHEMAHLRHEDVALSRLLASGLFGLLCFTLLGKLLLAGAAASGSTRTKEGGGGALLLGAIGLGMLVTGALGWVAAAVLDAATSREMEFRADADAARMLSDSTGLVGALVKLGQESKAFPAEASGWLRASNPMFFNVAAKRYWFDTHPPLLDRIRALDSARAAELQTMMGG
jgi:Zn-dependent protease with chaperone function